MELPTNITTPVAYLGPSLEEINDQRFLVLIPALIFVILFMFIGLFGNGVVIYIYGFRLQNSSINVLLLLLACFDMFCCIIGLPLQIVDIRLNFIYPSGHLCKFSQFVVFYSGNGSILTLLAICALRYHKVCRFSKEQMTVGQARLLAVFISLLALVLTIPAAVLFDVNETPIGPSVTGSLCYYKGSYKKLWIYLTVLLAYNLITLVTMFVLYGRIWVKARRQEALMRQLSSESSQASQRKPRTKNRIFVGITVLFTIGFQPSLLLGVLYPLYNNVQWSNGVEALRNVVFRMWILNSTLNPVIYGFFGLRFRREAKQIFMRSLSRSKSECSTSETPQ